VPTYCPSVPSDILQPEETWKDKGAYRQKALQLAERFQKNFERFASETTDSVRAAGPKIPVSR
jgi:phosphoenolpyruvate carboxykinase (ATP)